MVTVSEIQVHKAVAEQEQEQEQEEQQAEEGETGWITIDLGDDAITFDLLEIEGIEQYIGTREVEEGKYTQVRLVVDKVQVKLGDGDLQDATVPSNELKIVHPFDVIGGETTALVLDFDADKMVTVTGADNIIVKPVVKLTVRQEQRRRQKGEEKTKQETTYQASIEFQCDDFVSTAHISEELEVHAGDSFRIVLCSNPSTGFQWSELTQISDPTILQQTEHRFAPPKDKGDRPPAGEGEDDTPRPKDKGDRPPPGTPGKEVWTFKALKSGASTISMEYSRPWEGGEQGEWTFVLNVTVE